MLTVNQQEIHLGDIKFGKTYDFKYTVTNEYSTTCSITKLIVGCSSCTEASASKGLLSPNESADIRVKFTPGSTGAQSKVIYVEHRVEEKVRPNLVLKFKAVVQAN